MKEREDISIFKEIYLLPTNEEFGPYSNI